MHPICAAMLLTAAVGFADDPPLEREGEKLPIVKMPIAEIPTPRQRFNPPLLERAYPPDTDVAIEGKIEVADPKDFETFKIIVRFSVKEKNKGGWETVVAHRGGKPVKVKEGLYRYRSVIRTPQEPGRYFVHVYNHEQWCMSMAKVEVDEDVE